MADSIGHKKKAMVAALEQTLGVVQTACKIANISRDTHYRWLKEDAEYSETVKRIDDIAVDFAESKLHQLIKDGDTTATIFFLKTKGKRRGYIERNEVELTAPITLNFTPVASKDK